MRPLADAEAAAAPRAGGVPAPTANAARAGTAAPARTDLAAPARVGTAEGTRGAAEGPPFVPPPAGLRFTHLDKVLWPPAGPGGRSFTKADYLAYLRTVAPAVLPHLRDRPIVLTRYPHGAAGVSFYQKNLPPTAPPWLPRFRQRSASGRDIDYLVVRGVADLLWVGQQDAIEFHPWLSTCARPGFPDRAVVDLDPMPPAGFEEARAVALLVREVLTRCGVAAWLKTSGATGLHLFIPVPPVRPHGELVRTMQALGALVAGLWPERVTLERQVRLRGGRVYFDYLQNARGKTLCAPYCPRPLPGAPVSTPVAWEELPTVRPRDFDLQTVAARVRAGTDPFAALAAAPPQDLGALEELARQGRRAPRAPVGGRA